MARISVLRPGMNIILCEACGFVYIRLKVRVNDYQFLETSTNFSDRLCFVTSTLIVYLKRHYC
jgi:hypothetical protein